MTKSSVIIFIDPNSSKEILFNDENINELDVTSVSVRIKSLFNLQIQPSYNNLKNF